MLCLFWMKMQLEAEFLSQTPLVAGLKPSEGCWAMAVGYLLWDVLLRIFRCFHLVFTSAVLTESQNQRVIYLLIFPAKTQTHVLLLGQEECGAFFLSAYFPQKWIRSRLQLGLTWFIVVNRIRASASLKNIQMHGKSGTELLVSFFSFCDGHNDTPPSRGDLSGGSRQIICI